MLSFIYFIAAFAYILDISISIILQPGYNQIKTSYNEIIVSVHQAMTLTTTFDNQLYRFIFSLHPS